MTPRRIHAMVYGFIEKYYWHVAMKDFSEDGVKTRLY